MNASLRSLKQTLAGISLALAAATCAQGQGSSPQPPAQAAPQPAPPTLTVRAPMLIGGVTASREQIVFSFSGDLWRVARGGGEAKRLTDLPGEEDSPAFSPDGAWLAFNRDLGGGGDVWVMPAAGGEPRRLTWHPKEDRVHGWTPDGKKILFTTNRDGDGVWRLYTISTDGVMPEALPYPEGRQGAFSPDGALLAIVPFGPSWNHWRYYRGGSTSPIWLARPAGGKVEKRPALSSPDSDNRFPAWIGGTLYFVSDRTGTPNLFSHDLKTGKTEQLTRFPKHGILGASAAPDAIVFVAGGALHLWDPARREDRTVDVHLSLPAPERVAHAVPALKLIDQAVPAPDGSLIVSTRGEVLSFDPRTGQSRNLTRTPGVAERSAAPSPDGKWLAYFSDASGEYELHVRPAAGNGEIKRIAVETHPSFYRELTWSPDGRRIACSDKRLALWVANLESGTARRIATSPHIGQGVFIPSWSPDGRWLAYSQALANRVRTIFLFDAQDGEVHQVTDGKVVADLPAFDRSGRYLFFTTSANARTASAEDLGWGVMSSALARPLVTSQLDALVLRAGDPPPVFAAVGQPHPAVKWVPADGAVRIDLDGLASRIVPVATAPRDLVGLAAGPPGVLFAQIQEWPAAPGADDPTLILYRYDLSKGTEPEKIAADAQDFAVSADGGTLLYRTGDGGAPTLTMTPALGPVDAGRKPLDLAGLTVEVDPAAEWRQMYRETWRLARDWFYDPGHHGQDLPALEEHFAAYLPGVARRADLNNLFAQMLSYLSISHLVVAGGDVAPPAGKPERIGLLGADFTVDRGRFRISRIYRSGHPSAGSPLLRAPLDQPGVDVREGDYLLAVDGQEVRADRDLYSYFVGKALKPAEIKIGAAPEGGEVRTAVVIPLPGENTLRRMDWAERNRRQVEEISAARLAYVYLPNHGFGGYEELLRGTLGNLDVDGLVIDQRWSPGGVVFDSVIELLQRQPIYAYAWREGNDLPMPTNFGPGPKALIVNRQNGSAAETFALMWKLAGLGPVVGTRTFGGGIGGALFSPDLIDGGQITIPNRASYDPNGTWGIENDGVHPDVEVEWDAESFQAGRDPQLEAAIRAVLAEIRKAKKWAPKKPAYPKYP
jgi:tricorn protease